jgi:lysostaphin
VSGKAAVGGNDALTVEPKQPHQGQTVLVKLVLSAAEPVPDVEFNKDRYKLFPLTGEHATSPSAVPDKVFRALIGIPADMAPGSYDLTAGANKINLAVAAGTFGVQRLHLPKEKDNFIASPGEQETVDKAKSTLSDEQLWNGHFKHPSNARISTRFGLRRIVNGRPLKDYFHSGLDYAAALGTPVLAGQKGTVILAHKGFKLHGNVVAIDHGQGVISFYIHLKDIAVKEGDMVNAGQIIGHVGQSGRANGPHLHFSIYINGVATDPQQWFSKSFD